MSISLPSCGSTWLAEKSVLIALWMSAANSSVIEHALGSIVKNGDECGIEKEQCLPGTSTMT